MYGNKSKHKINHQWLRNHVKWGKAERVWRKGMPVRWPRGVTVAQVWKRMITVGRTLTKSITDIQSMTKYSCSAPFEIFRQRQMVVFFLEGYDDSMGLTLCDCKQWKFHNIIKRTIQVCVCQTHKFVTAWSAQWNLDRVAQWWDAMGCHANRCRLSKS